MIVVFNLAAITHNLHHSKHVNYHKQHIFCSTKVSTRFTGFHPNVGNIVVVYFFIYFESAKILYRKQFDVYSVIASIGIRKC